MIWPVGVAPSLLDAKEAKSDLRMGFSSLLWIMDYRFNCHLCFFFLLFLDLYSSVSKASSMLWKILEMKISYELGSVYPWVIFSQWYLIQGNSVIYELSSFLIHIRHLKISCYSTFGDPLPADPAQAGGEHENERAQKPQNET